MFKPIPELNRSFRIPTLYSEILMLFLCASHCNSLSFPQSHYGFLSFLRCLIFKVLRTVFDVSLWFPAALISTVQELLYSSFLLLSTPFFKFFKLFSEVFCFDAIFSATFVIISNFSYFCNPFFFIFLLFS